MNGRVPWLIGACSVRGTGHVRQNIPNQDRYRIMPSDDGSVIAVVVSDGAGSAPRAEEGAQACVDIMAPRLLEIGLAVNAKTLAPTSIKERVARAIMEVRDRLDPTGMRLGEYHHTLTGLMLTPAGGVLVQIGDSPAIVTKAVDGVDGVDFFAKHTLHLPEKGEYANETYFVTQPNWQSQLKILSIASDPSDFDAVLLMSDGAGELALCRNVVFRPFIGALLSNLLKAEDEPGRNASAKTDLSNPGADTLTSDDKTLVVICRENWARYAHRPFVASTDSGAVADPPKPTLEPVSDQNQPPTPRPTPPPGPAADPRPTPDPRLAADPRRATAPRPPLDPQPPRRPAVRQASQAHPAREPETQRGKRTGIISVIVVLLLALALGAAWRLGYFGEKFGRPHQSEVAVNATVEKPAKAEAGTAQEAGKAAAPNGAPAVAEAAPGQAGGDVPRGMTANNTPAEAPSERNAKPSPVSAAVAKVPAEAPTGRNTPRQTVRGAQPVKAKDEAGTPQQKAQPVPGTHSQQL